MDFLVVSQSQHVLPNVLLSYFYCKAFFKKMRPPLSDPRLPGLLGRV